MVILTLLENIRTYDLNASEEIKQEISSLLKDVTDPEIPVLTIEDLGLIRNIHVGEHEIEVVLTPTYSGCPAMDAIAMDVKMKLLSEGHPRVKVSYALQPAWTTEWMSEEGKRKLREYGIAPPPRFKDKDSAPLSCPKCSSINTEVVSEFGSTACKSLCQCLDCLEFFDHFKCH
jgi:ring-1,2-phenylacetyl-CoA epoxidase subunit PaaD